MRILVGGALVCVSITGGCGLSTTGIPGEPQPPPPKSCKETLDCIGPGAPSNPCLVDACVGGVCTTAPATSPHQIEGDCKQVTCNGVDPKEQIDVDDADDGNPCTEDSCGESGEPKHVPAAPGTRCTIGDTLVGECDASGTCVVACETDAQCNDNEPCTIDACDAATKTCNNQPTTGSHPSAPAIPGDCKETVCVDGKAQVLADAADPPDDKKECTVDTCSGTEPTFTPQPAGTPCGGGMGECNAAGDCVGCVNDEFCGDPPPCLVFACENQVCTTTKKPAGTLVSDLSPHDCVKNVCDGNGGTTFAPDDDDTPVDDMNDCTLQACSGGVAVTTLLSGDSCNDDGGTYCVAGACVQCTAATEDIDCGPTKTCIGGKCCETCQSLGATCGLQPDGCGNMLDCNDGVKNGTEADVDCGNVAGCAKCQSGKTCGTDDAACVSGSCREGYCCSTPCNGTCRACAQVLTGQPNGMCAAVIPGLKDPGTCEGSSACNGMMGQGSCVQKKANGEACNDSADCASGICTDDVCCNTPCSSVCQSCIGSETNSPVNVCAPVVADTDPQDDCSSNECCNGAGACYASQNCM